MAIAQGTSKQIRIKRQSAKGALAGTSDGQILRRETATFELQKETFNTASEITTKQQLLSSRHGPKMVNGSISGLLSPGTYSDPLSALLRRDFTAVSNITGLSITIAGTAPTQTVTRASGSWLTDGIKVGMVVRLTAGSFVAGNLNKNLLVTAVTALALTVQVLNGLTITNEGPIASATLAVPGKVTYAPDSGHTKIYHTVEEWYPDAAVSERNLDVRFVQADLALPGSGNATIQFTAMGLDQTSDTTAYFTSPAAETTTEVVNAAGGALLVNGSSVAVLTDLNISINGNGAAADAVVGTNIRPDVFVGKVLVTGSFTAYFEGGTIPNLYINETATSIISVLTGGAAANADFISLAMTNIKLTTSTPDDAETGLKRSYSFEAIYDATGGAAAAKFATTIAVQDSQAG